MSRTPQPDDGLVVVVGRSTGRTYRWAGGKALTVNIYDPLGKEVDVMTLGGSGGESEDEIATQFCESIRQTENCAAGQHAEARGGFCSYCGVPIDNP